MIVACGFDHAGVPLRERLLSAGFPSDLAERLAHDCAADLHALLDLVDRRCPPELAARILAPIDEESGP